MKRLRLALAVCLLAVGSVSRANADATTAPSAAAPSTATAATAAEEGPEATFRRAVALLQSGAYNDAVDAFEDLADRGFYHPDASFDRALAYIGRVRANAERTGDLGRAAAALEEVIEARPGDPDAERTLELVRAEVAHRRARGGTAAEVEARPTLDRALIGLASEQAWAFLAALASLILTAGLVLRQKAAESAVHLAGTIAAPLGALALVVFVPLAAGARHLRLTTQPGVVVAQEARLGNDRGLPNSSGAVPEAARVEIDDRQGDLVHVRWGSAEGWTQASAVKPLARP